MTKTEIAWAAGLFEGEGTVRISRPQQANWGALTVSIVNTDRQILDWFQQRWPGYIKSVSLSGNRRDAWVWLKASKQAAAFLTDIRPYIVRDAVRRKIDHGLAFQRQKRIGGSLRWVTQSELDDYMMEQWNAHWWMCQLNKRGREETL